MKLLFNLALKNKKAFPLITLMIVSMCLLTVATQMEIITIGILTKKGPGFFELFGPEKNGNLSDTQTVSKEQLLQRFNEIDSKNEGSITKEEVNTFLTEKRKFSLVDHTVIFINKFLPITSHPEYLAVLVLAIALFNACSMFTYRFTAKMIAITVSKDLRQRYFEHIQKLPLSFYHHHNIGSLSSRVLSDAIAIADGTNATLTNYLQTPFTITTTLILCFIMSWKLSLFIFIGLPLIAYPIILIARHVKRIAKLLQKNHESFSSVLIDFLSGIQTVKLFGMEKFSHQRYIAENEKIAMLERKSAKYDVSSRPIVHTIGMTMLSISLIIGLYFLDMSVPEVLVYAGMLYIFYEPVKKFAETNSIIQRGAAAAERMQEVLKVEPSIVNNPGAIDLHFSHSIQFKNLSFRYQNEWVLKNLHLEIKKGETVALVGPTGSGKSTLIQLLSRLYDIEEGEILIDEKPIKSYTIESLKANIAFVPQRPFLFLGTIRENIAFGRECSDEEVYRAAKDAHALEFIENLPAQFFANVSETGKNFSGGQQQRIAIARALIGKAPILILDEATSALDTISEQLIKNTLLNLKHQTTQIIIAHRLSTISNADKIVYMEKGSILAVNTFQKMLETCTPFKKMWEAMIERQESTSASPE